MPILGSLRLEPFFIATMTLDDPLGNLYLATLVGLSLFCGATLLADKECKFACIALSARATAWDLSFLVPFAVCVAADWLQGPYVYDLYDSYGYDRTTINALFVVGFSASMVLGPPVGALADRFGRKRMILVGYCLVYAAACVTKHFKTLWVLYMGRVFGGGATSVLFSCFESWLVAEYRRRELGASKLQDTISRMYFVNGLSGILMGVIANQGANAWPLASVGGSAFHVGGVIVPFDMSFACLCVGGLLVGLLWTGDSTVKPNDAASSLGLGSLQDAYLWLSREPLVLLLLAASALTEAAM